MTTEEAKERFKQANQTIHQVEAQWHYPILIKHGYISDTKESIGLVRSYKYHHPTTKHQITCTTGSSADYWESNSGCRGYWTDLEPHIMAI